tara:strand:+ start:1915 stop:2127 length:213 start_codon:yes stop_codon:yes gene_type:complete
MRGDNTPIINDNLEMIVELNMNMAKLLQLDPQQIVDALQRHLEDNKMKSNIDPDIEAIVNSNLLGGGSNV